MQLNNQALADAYQNAWLAVKRSPCTVEVMPCGWFHVRKNGMTTPESVRANTLLEGLVILTQRFIDKSKLP
jgi:hypothetical protein